MSEEWRRVSYHRDYEVSSLGRVRSWKRGQPRIMRPYTDKLGYVRVSMDGINVSIHRAIAEAWHGPCPDGKEVDHLNNVRDDNRPENLRYLTRQENMARMAERPLPTHCMQGHPFSGDNLYVRPSNGRRICKTCQLGYIGKRRDVLSSSDLICTIDGCSRVATNRLTTSEPICEPHYQRERRLKKRAA
jgi:hypothetical protein